jgi:hypothetical protein
VKIALSHVEVRAAEEVSVIEDTRRSGLSFWGPWWRNLACLSALWGVLLIAGSVVVSFVAPELSESRLGLAVGATLCPMGLLLGWLSRPTTASWHVVLRVFACAALAVSSVWLWWAISPVGGCVVAGGYAIMGLLQIGLQIALARFPAGSNTAAGPCGEPRLGLQAGPERRDEVGTGSA